MRGKIRRTLKVVPGREVSEVQGGIVFRCTS